MPHYKVEIVKCTGDGETIHTSEHDCEDRFEAIRLAAVQGFGKGAYVLKESSLAEFGYYGQVAKNLHGSRPWQARTLTGRVRVDVTEINDRNEGN